MPIDDSLYLRHTQGRGLVEIFLRGHLWVEKYLTELIVAELKQPAAMPLERVGFAQKVNLAEALGLVESDEAKTLRLLNRLRNRLAHDLAGEPTADDLAELEQSLTGRHLRGFAALANQSPEHSSWPADEPEDVKRLSMLCLAVVVALETHRQQHAYWRAYGEDIRNHEMLKRLEELFPSSGPSVAAEWYQSRSVPEPPDGDDLWVRHT